MKFALITGSSGGIGSSTALKLAEEGWNLYLHYHTNKKAVEELIHKVEGFGVEAIPIRADLSLPEEVGRLVESIFRLDAIIYCSGNSSWGLFQDQTENHMDEMINLHVKSPLILVQKLLPKIIERKGGIVMVSSIWGQIGGACEVVYSTVKGAQLAFVKSLSKELALSGVRVNAVAPGVVETAMMSAFTDDDKHSLYDEIPMGRFAQPDEIADSIQFLLSSKATYITGQTLSVNGGWYT
ncbi:MULTISPECIES: elongation factor P 5-aminopentanone reductase [Bacillaceae]|uniref:elongation factor P 5-aminopentanone reductase n=1 Tax=Bacillaceae TaxID=186817 RepID=UPI001C5A448C|nr:SDR family oxidoreductase [Rossellomorea sp. YZS02]MBW3113804.1 SDR family oxidoreductase [Bacillus sp. MCCB 382]MDX8343953.1 SDR family oxidoreductase [Rossellomorea sp. YZS02]